MTTLSRDEGTSTRASTAASFYEAEISFDETEDVGKPRMGLGSTANENIALRRNHREMELLWKTQKTLVDEEEYVLKLIDLYEKGVQLNYKRLTKRVKKIKSHLTEEEIVEMENDLRKKEFADKYRMLLHNEEDGEKQKNDPNNMKEEDQSAENQANVASSPSKPTLQAITEEPEHTSSVQNSPQKDLTELSTTKSKLVNDEQLALTEQSKQKINQPIRSQTTQVTSNRSNHIDKARPETTPNFNSDDVGAMNDIIPSLDSLLDQLHNIKPHQFYENQRKLKLYEIRLLEEELRAKKTKLFKDVDRIVNWDKKEEEKEEEVEEEEKPRTRKTSFMRSVIRNFSMELMMKTMQYGWTDIGQCRYLRNKGGDEDADMSGANTLARDTMKIKMDHAPPDEDPPQGGAREKRPEPGFDANGKMIRTADLLGLK